MIIAANPRARLAIAVLIGVMVFLLGSLYHELKMKDREITRLATVQQTVAAKLSDIFTHVLAAETAALEQGKTPDVRIQTVLEEIRGVDQKLVSDALQDAYRRIARGDPGPPGPQGQPGPAGPPGAPATTTTFAATTTTTAPPPSTTTTTSPSTTTTTRPAPPPCRVGVLGLCLLVRG